MIGKFVLITLGGLSISGAAVGSIIMLGHKNEVQDLTDTEIKEFIKSGTVAEKQRWRITDSEINKIQVSDMDQNGLKTHWLTIIEKMPASFFHKFTDDACMPKHQCMKITEDIVKHEYKTLYVPFATPTEAKRLKVVIDVENNEHKKVNISFNQDIGKPIEISNFTEEHLKTKTNWMKDNPPSSPEPNDETIKSIIKMYDVYNKTIKRMKDLGIKQMLGKPSSLDW